MGENCCKLKKGGGCGESETPGYTGGERKRVSFSKTILKLRLFALEASTQ